MSRHSRTHTHTATGVCGGGPHGGSAEEEVLVRLQSSLAQTALDAVEALVALKGSSGKLREVCDGNQFL